MQICIFPHVWKILYDSIQMKKFLWIMLSVILISAFSFNKIQALELADLTPALDQKIANMKTTEAKVKWLQKYSDLLATPKFTQSKDAKLYEKLRWYTLNMLNVFQHQLMEEQAQNTTKNQTKKTNTTTSQNTTYTQSTKNLPHISDNFSNVDVKKVREAILSWHNSERISVWVNPYVYNLDLEWSATTRANVLAESGKTSNLHLRNAWDGYYNYKSMLSRFSNLWINFPSSAKWATSFSESIWYGTYKCSKTDCTDDLINAIKKTWTWLIMREKSSKGSHYRAAVMKHFTQMWAWIAIDKSHNRYYIVLHYWVSF